MYRHSPLMRSLLSQFQTPTGPRRAVGFFGSGCPTGYPAKPITQSTSDWLILSEPILSIVDGTNHSPQVGHCQRPFLVQCIPLVASLLTDSVPVFGGGASVRFPQCQSEGSVTNNAATPQRLSALAAAGAGLHHVWASAYHSTRRRLTTNQIASREFR
jgi:hypothetical protein